MHTSHLARISLFTLIATAFWLVLLIGDQSVNGSPQNYQEALTLAQTHGPLFTLIYLNAILITLGVTALFAGFYVNLRPASPGWATIALMFIPMYAGFNLFVYGSQVTILPALADIQAGPAVPAAQFLTAQFVQSWSGSMIAMINNMAYGVLGVPSFIYGVIMLRGSRLMWFSGVLLIMNGIAAIIGVLGTITGSQQLQLGTLVSGVLFLLALIPLTIAFYRDDLA